jgi:hypothetical protein
MKQLVFLTRARAMPSKKQILSHDTSHVLYERRTQIIQGQNNHSSKAVARGIWPNFVQCLVFTAKPYSLKDIWLLQ